VSQTKPAPVPYDSSASIEVCLEKYLRSVGLVSVWHLAKIHKYWLFILDGPTANKVRPYKLHRSILTLRVIDAAYGAVFHYKKRALIKKLNQLDDDLHIRDIKFEVGPVGHDLWDGSSPDKVYQSQIKKLDALRQVSQKKGLPMTEETALQVSNSFYSTKQDYVDLVLPDGTEVRRHKADLGTKRHRAPKIHLSTEAEQQASSRAELIQNPKVKKAFIKALGAKLDQEKRP